MKIVHNDLYCKTEQWDDPGDYPNAVAGYPMASYQYCDYDGVFEFVAETAEEVAELDDPYDWINDWIHEECEIDSGCSLNLDIKVEGNTCTVKIESAEYQPDYD